MSENYDVKIGSLEWEFTPKFSGGVVKATLRMLTVNEVDECISVSAARGIDRPKMVTYGLKELHHLTIDGKAIKTAAELIASPKLLMPLFIELWLEIQSGSTVTEKEVKNS